VETVLAASEELPVWVPPERLRDAVLRLLQHAIQGNREKEVIQISLFKSCGQACLAITCPGQGARRGNCASGRSAPTLGHRFSQAAQQGKLEWAIARTLVEAMRGALQVESGAPEGLRYCLYLPLAEKGTTRGVAAREAESLSPAARGRQRAPRHIRKT
jgi:light-regulated signal transduction histidine kinase (bacteriophytochrome)